jgi:hypothetical protein
MRCLIQKIYIWAKLTHSRENISEELYCMVGYLLAKINARNHLDGRMRHVALGDPVQGLCKHCPEKKKMVLIGTETR